MYRRAGASQTDPSASRGSSRVPPLVWCWEPLTCPCLKTGAKGRGGSVGGEDRHADRPDVDLVVPRGGGGRCSVAVARGVWSSTAQMLCGLLASAVWLSPLLDH